MNYLFCMIKLYKQLSRSIVDYHSIELHQEAVVVTFVLDDIFVILFYLVF